MVLLVKNLPPNAGDVRDTGSIPGSGRPSGEGHDTPLQYSRMENPMDRGAWRATVNGVAKSWTRLKQLSMYIHYREIQLSAFYLQHQMQKVSTNIVVTYLASSKSNLFKSRFKHLVFSLYLQM